MEQCSCKNCGVQFEITESDHAFYKKIDVPEPTFCPDCRLQRRLSFRNERFVFRRKCDKCDKSMISFFRPKEPFPVYCSECWWSDSWDPLDYAQDYDFSRPFFDQFQELMMKVPKAGLLVYSCENSEYNTLLAYCKNTYMSVGCYFCEDVYYLTKSQKSKDCSDGIIIDNCELVNYSVNSTGCYNAHHLINCKNCNDSGYLADCVGCENCFMCSGLMKKKFHYKNKQYPEEEYRKLVDEKMKTEEKDLLKEFFEFNKTIPKKYQNQIQCEDSSGNYLENCNNAKECYDCIRVEDSKYLLGCVDVKDSMDVTNHDKDIELCYELCTGGDSSVNTRFSFCAVLSPDCEYLYISMGISDCFGCDGLHSKEKYCILNKKYSKEEYESMVKKIKDQMRKNGEYGEFFPARLSLYPYNHSAAQDCYPLTKEEALAKGYIWQDKDPKEYQPATYLLPVNVKEVPDTVVNEILACEDCEKNYKILSQELLLHRKMNVSLSKKCPDCRQLELQKFKNPRKLYDRKCDKCGIEIQTTYSPDRPESVYCGRCYLNNVV